DGGPVAAPAGPGRGPGGGGRPMKPGLTTAAALPLARSRLADYLELTKPRVAVLVLFTVAAGYWLGSLGHTDPVLLLHTVAGTALVAAGARAPNQLLERHSDARIPRPAPRPPPPGPRHARRAPALALA